MSAIQSMKTHCSYHNEDPDPVKKNGTGKQKGGI